MLLKIHCEKNTSQEQPRLENMLVSGFNEMALFTQNIRWGDQDNGTAGGVVEVRYRGTMGIEKGMLEVPLIPEIIDLEGVDVVLHHSPTKAYKMGGKYDAWFSSCFGFDVSVNSYACVVS